MEHRGGIAAHRRRQRNRGCSLRCILLSHFICAFFLRMFLAYFSLLVYFSAHFLAQSSCVCFLRIFLAHFSHSGCFFGAFSCAFFLHVFPAHFFCAFFAVRSLTLYCQNSYTISAAAESNYSSSSIEVEEQRQQNAAGEEELRSSVTIEEAAAAAAQTLWQQCIAASGL